MKRIRIVTCVAALTVGLFASRAWPVSPAGTAFTYQGQLKKGGVPVNDTADFQFTLWDAGVGGAQIGPTLTFDGAGGNPPPVYVVNGLFTVVLEFGGGVFAGQARWLEVAVKGSADAGYTTLLPRRELTPTPYALYALNSGSASLGLPYAGDATSSEAAFAVGNSGSGHAIYGEASGSDAVAVYGHNANGVAVKGRSENDGGVVGWTGAGDKSGVFGNSAVGTGVTGRSEAPSGYGVAGTALGAQGSGVYGTAAGSGGVGVYGYNNADGIGVKGRSAQHDGVVGWTGASDKSGVFGYSEVGKGVTGRSEGSDGVVGVTTSSNPGHAAVHARNEGAGPAVFCEGDLVVTGAYRGTIGPNSGAPFPRPAYKSAWRALSHSPEGETFNHGLGGNPEDYVIEFRLRAQDDHSWLSWGGDPVYRVNNKRLVIWADQSEWLSFDLQVLIWVFEP